jgi:hypothetical protein
VVSADLTPEGAYALLDRAGGAGATRE